MKSGQKTFVRSLNTKGAISICKEEGTKMAVMVDSMRTMLLTKMLQERNIPYQVSVAECLAITPTGNVRKMGSPVHSARRRLIKSPTKKTLDWKDFYPLESVYNFLESLEVQYPSTCSVIVIGKSVEGRDIKVLKISNSNATNTGIWLDGTIHAREWISTSVVTYIASQIAKNFQNLGEPVTNKDWYFLPVMNPDGYHHTFTVDRMWRKNRTVRGNTIVGVDLNRNFSYHWGSNSTEMSSDDPSHRNYRGPEPFSEPESAAVKDLILYAGTPFKIFLTFHAYSEVIGFPWCFSADPCPDYVNLLEGGTCMAKAIYESTGRMYKVGSFKEVMYYACGTSIDWSYGTAKIPFSYLVELRSKKDKFILPTSEIMDCCREIYSGVIALVKYVDGKKCVNCKVFDDKTKNA